MKLTNEQLLQQLKDNINKVVSDMVTLSLHDYETTGKGLIVGDKPLVTPELVVDLFEAHVKRVFNPEYVLPTLNSLAIFRLMKYDPVQEVLHWNKTASSIYVKQNP